jgi:tetratricopeptide (TPR) repeat protein
MNWSGLGLALLGMGRYRGALKSFDKALRQREFHLADNWVFRAEALAGLGRYQEAVESYEKAIQCGLETEARLGWMEALKQLEKFVRERVPKPQLEAYESVAFIEERLHHFIRRRLGDAFGKEENQWWGQGVPLTIRQKCAQRREEDPRRKPVYNYTDLIDLKEILDKNWKLFETDFERVKGKAMGKKGFLDNLIRLNEVRKTVMHPVRSPVTEEDLQFGQSMRDMIESFAPLE